MHSRIAETVLELLAKERAVIRQGALRQLSDIARRKLDLLEQLGKSSIEPGKLSTIEKSLLRNAGLLRAARDGVRSARARLDALQAVRDGLNLYTSSGDRKVVGRRPESLEHKA